MSDGFLCRTWLNSVASSVFALDKRYNKDRSEYPYLKHSPFIYSKAGCQAVVQEYRAEFRTTMEHKFRNGERSCHPRRSL